MRTVDEVAAFLGVAPAHLVKTLLFETEGGPVAALIRGDAEVNESKLRDALGCSRLELASEAAIHEITGGPVGFSGPVGLRGVRVVADPTVMGLGMAVTGANAADTHLLGVVPGLHFTPDEVADVRRTRAGDPCTRCGEPLGERRGIEVGHVFKLGSKYSAPMGCVYLGPDGAERPMVMGCYGLGLGRTVAAAVEQGHDEAGISWPLALAPYEVALVVLNTDQEEVVSAAEGLYDRLCEAGMDVLFDDREERPGVKFTDLDLIGFPVRLVVGRKGLAEGRVELSLRRDRVKRMVPLKTVIDEVNSSFAELRPATV